MIIRITRGAFRWNRKKAAHGEKIYLRVSARMKAEALGE